jgi:DNA-binding transcriptional MerR regulator
MRMAELAARSGVARETIHFYLREGLLPRPEKGGRTVAYYGEEHLNRLKLIRHLREDKYLPIAEIRRLLESPAAESDLDVLADVLHIIPTGDEGAAPPSADARAVAAERGLLGPRSAAGFAQAPREDATDLAERRVLAVVDQALGLDEETKKLTLADITACAPALTELVGREAVLFFDAMFESGDVVGSIRALRAGRPAVARFIAAYRDLLLRRIVDEILYGLEHGPELVVRTATVPLSQRREAELGVPSRRSALRVALSREGDEGAASRLVWHLFETGAVAELSTLPIEIVGLLPPRLRVFTAWGAFMTGRSETALQALTRAVETVPDFALGQILLGEAVIARGLRKKLGGRSVLEAGIPAFARVFTVDPDRDPEPAARAFGWFHRGRLELALPAVLGRRERGLASLDRVLRLLDGAPEGIEPAARVRLSANTRLALARAHAALGDLDRSRALLDEAAAMDPGGLIAAAARP